MSDENERPEKVDELISQVAEKWGYNEATIEDTLGDLGIDVDSVPEEKAKAAYEAFEEEDSDEFVAILKDVSETPEMVEAFRDKFLSDEEQSDDGTQAQAQPVETPDAPDAPSAPTEDADEDELREHVAELTQVVQQQSQAIKETNQAIQQAASNAPAQQQSKPQPAQQQGGGGGMLDMSPGEVELLKMVGNIVRSNNDPNPWAERMQDMQEQMFVAQMKQLESQTGETPGQKLGRKFDDQLADEALKNMKIDFSGGSGKSDDGGSDSGGDE